MAAGPQNTEDTLSEVNVIPLADVSLVMLIILMVISPMVMQSMINVQAGRATAVQAPPSDPPEPPLIVAVQPDGLYLNSVKMGTDLEFLRQLNQAIARRIEKRVLVTADPTVLHGRVVEILDMVKQNGAERVALLKKKP